MRDCSRFRIWRLPVVLLFGTVSCAGASTKPTNAEDSAAGGPGTGGGSHSESGPSGAESGEKAQSFDLNHDNQPEVWAYYTQAPDPQDPKKTKGVLVRKEWDFNFDGKVDIRRFFGAKEEIIKDELDLDFDGKFDVVTYYQNGVKVRQEYDFNFDRNPDFWKFFEKNVIARSERDRDFNGRVDRWEYFVNGKLDRVGLDEDGDGQIDKWIQQAGE